MIEEVPRDVATGLCEAAGEPSLNGVALQVDRHDRDRARCISRGPKSVRADRKKHVDLPADQVSGETRQGLRLPARKSDLERYVLAIDVAEVSQTLSGIIEYRPGEITGIQHTHHWHLHRLLCGGERPREEATCNAADERSPVHY